MITIKNTQRTISIDKNSVIRDVERILVFLDYTDFDIGIWCTSNATIRRYNRLYRNKDKVTDILSFPHHPHLKAGKHITAHNEDDKNLGDLIIAPAYVKKDAPTWGHSFEERMRILLVHGICHLLGYDHIDDKDYKIMHKKEQSILKHLANEHSY